MLAKIFTVFIFLCILFFMFSLWYSHFIKIQKKSLDTEDKECYNRGNEK